MSNKAHSYIAEFTRCMPSAKVTVHTRTGKLRMHVVMDYDVFEVSFPPNDPDNWAVYIHGPIPRTEYGRIWELVADIFSNVYFAPITDEYGRIVP